MKVSISIEIETVLERDSKMIRLVSVNSSRKVARHLLVCGGSFMATKRLAATEMSRWAAHPTVGSPFVAWALLEFSLVILCIFAADDLFSPGATTCFSFVFSRSPASALLFRFSRREPGLN